MKTSPPRAAAMESGGSAADAPLRALARRGVGFARLAAAARALRLPGAPGGEFAAAGAALASVLRGRRLLLERRRRRRRGRRGSGLRGIRGYPRGYGLARGPGPHGARRRAGLCARRRLAAAAVLLAGVARAGLLLRRGARGALFARFAPAAAPWRGWRPPAPAPSSASAYAPPSLELVRLAALSSAAVARGAAAAGKARRAGWRLSAADVASAERAAAAFHGLLLPISRDGPASSSAPSLEVLGGLLADVWLDGRVFPPSLPPADAAAAVAAVAAEGGGENGDAGDSPLLLPLLLLPLLFLFRRPSPDLLLLPLPARRDALPPWDDSGRRRPLRVADAAAARGATLLPRSEDALAVCRRCGCSSAGAQPHAEEDKDLSAPPGCLPRGPARPSRGLGRAGAAAAAAAGRRQSGETAAEAATEEGGEGERAAPSAAPSLLRRRAPPPPRSWPRWSPGAPSSSSPRRPGTARDRVRVSAGGRPAGDRAVAVEKETNREDRNEREEQGEEQQQQLSDWRACSLPAAAACLASAGPSSSRRAVASRHAGQSSAGLGHLSACLPLLRAYLRSLVLPPLCDPRRAPEGRRGVAAPAPAPGAVAAVWRGLPGAAVEALRVLDEATAAE